MVADRDVSLKAGGAMTVYGFIREDQHQHGYLNVSIAGMFRQKQVAPELEEIQRCRALGEGRRVCDEFDSDPDGEVSWKIEEHDINLTLGRG